MLKQDEHLWRVDKWERLYTGCDCLNSAEKETQTSVQTNTPKTILDDSNSTSCWLCHKICAHDVRKDGIANATLGQWTVGCCEHIAAVLWYPTCSYQRNQAGDVLSETNFCGTVNVLEVVDKN